MFKDPGRPLEQTNNILSKELISKYKTVTHHRPLTIPDPKQVEHCWFPENLLDIAKAINTQTCPKFKKPSFKFDMSQQSALHNWNILQNYNNLGEALKSQKGSQLDYGSEFRDPTILENIFAKHPLWSRLKHQLIHGSSFPLEDLSCDKRREDVIEALEYGNHKGVSGDLELFKNMMNNDVIHGYSLVLPRSKIIEIEGALLAPMNIADQHSINERGEIVAKKRLTHNQSYKFGSGTSVNSRVIKDDLQDCMYGSCLFRIIHEILNMRTKHPHKRVLLQKIDWKAAYRRSHLNWETAIQTITQSVEMDLAFLSLRLTFGGAPNPNYWGEVSESTTDLANALLRLENWDPKELASPIQDKVPKAEPDNDPTPFAQALPLAVDLDENDDGKADVYIDDITSVVVDIGNNIERGEAAVLLATHLIGRPFDTNDPLKRLDLVSITKLIAEARLEETKVLLGWVLDTRLLKVSLTFEKYTAWSESIKSILETKTSTFNDLDSLIGRIGHTSVINPYVKHFMSRIRQEKDRAENRKKIKISSIVLDDLELHLDFLRLAYEGISMNQISYRSPTHSYRADACPFGLGGYSSRGRAWRWFIPPKLRYRATLNMLEHLCSIIGPWIDLLENALPEFSCILAMGDSTTAAGWLKKSNFKYSQDESFEMTEAKLKLSRDHALRLMSHKCSDYSQWFKGDDNDVADSLSRDHHIPPNVLTQLFHTSIPNQTPKNLKISPLPLEIHSYITSILQSLPEETQQQEKLKTSKVARGVDGMSSSQISNWEEILFLKSSQKDNKQSSFQPSAKQSVNEDLLKFLEMPWWGRLSKPPWTTYHRPSETITNLTQETTEKDSLAAFYNNSSRATKMRIQLQNKRKRSP